MKTNPSALSEISVPCMSTYGIQSHTKMHTDHVSADASREPGILLPQLLLPTGDWRPIHEWEGREGGEEGGARATVCAVSITRAATVDTLLATRGRWNSKTNRWKLIHPTRKSFYNKVVTPTEAPSPHCNPSAYKKADSIHMLGMA